MWSRRLICCSHLPSVPVLRRLHDVVIAAAVRTPITRCDGQLRTLPATHLGACAIRMCLMQAAIPHSEVDTVYMGQSLAGEVGNGPVRQAVLAASLPKRVYSAQMDTSVQAFTMALRDIKAGEARIVVVGGMESPSNAAFHQKQRCAPKGSSTQEGDENVAEGESNIISSAHMEPEELREYIGLNYERLIAAWSCGAFDAELVPIQYYEKGKQPLVVAKDQFERTLTGWPLSDGASALVLMSSETASKYNIRPLARVVGSQKVSSGQSPATLAHTTAVEQLLSECKLQKSAVALWEIDDCLASRQIEFQRDLALPEHKVNIHGDITAAAGYALSAAGTRAIAHLAHNPLPGGSLMCAVVGDGDGGATSILLEKLSTPNLGKNGLPLITLYTKDPCPLCDELVEELEAHFHDQYELEKVFITDQTNVRFRRIFRYDIPVVFLNGQFLCMHKLNVNMLSRRLSLINQS